MLRKVIRIICYMLLWNNQFFNWLDMLETWQIFSPIKNSAIFPDVTLIFATASYFGLIKLIKWAWKNDN